jgi:uncharacterized protein (DUF2141 family)
MFLGVLGLVAATALAQDKSRLTVDLVGFHSDKGKVACELFSSADGYPTQPEKAVKKMVADISGGKATCAFDDLPDGEYAVAAFHDENGNGKLDANFLGIPKEGVGASNDAKGHFGPPRYADAHFTVHGATQIVVHIVY